VIRSAEFNNKVADPDLMDADLAALIASLNESFAEDEGMPEAAAHRQDIPHELLELDHSFQHALFADVQNSAPVERQAPEVGKPQQSHGRAPGLTGSLALVMLLALGALWYGLRIDTKFMALEESLTQLSRETQRNSSTVEKSGQELSSIIERQQQNNQSIQKIERLVEELRQSKETELARLGEQIEALQQADAVAEPAVPPIPAAEPEPEPKPEPKPSAKAEPEPGSKISPAWGINLAAYASQAAATREIERFRAVGLDVVVQVVRVAKKDWYRLRIDGFADRRAATSFIQQNRHLPELAKAWVSRER